MSVQGEYKDIIAQAKEKLVTIIEKNAIPGAAIAVLSKDSSFWLEGFGFTDLSHKQQVNVDTLFGLQSTTKTYTAVAFLLAMQQGLVKLDDPIIKYYPEFRVKSRAGADEYKKITFRHLLSHTSGLPRESRIGGCFSHVLPTWEEHIQSLSNSWMNNPVGKRFNYSNIGMDLVPYLLERIVKKPYYQYIQEVLGNPLGITLHWFMDKIYDRSNSAKGHLGDYPAHKLDGVAFGCGSLFLSIKDQAKFVQFLLNKGKVKGKALLQTKNFELLRTIDGDMGYGLGTEVSHKFGVQTQNHAGGGFGLGSEMYWLPEQNLGFALLYNNENEFENMQGFTAELIKQFLQKKNIAMKENTFPFVNSPIITLEKQKLERLVGIYENFEMTTRVEVIGKELYLTHGDEKKELKPHSDVAFSMPSGGGIIFELNKEGKPVGSTQYHTSLGVLKNRFLGNPQKNLTQVKKDWTKYVGLYYYKYYYTEYYFTAVTLDKDGFLEISGETLYPYEALPNIFFTGTGTTVEFNKDSFYLNNILYTRLANLVDFYKKLVETEPKHRALVSWVLDSVISSLKKLNREAEAIEMTTLKQIILK